MNGQILIGDALEQLKTLPDESVNCCVTSPPYWGLRDYGVTGQMGLEKSPMEYVENMVAVFREVKRVLRSDGTLWLNLGDSYATGAGSNRVAGGKAFGKANHVIDAGAFPISQPNRLPIAGLKPKDLVGIPWRVAFALQADGWWLRQEIIWHKPNPMPESVTDRCTKSHEQIFLLAKSEVYFFDMKAIKEPATKGWANSKFHTGKTGQHQLGRSSKVRKREKNNGESAVDCKTRGHGNYCGDAKGGMRQRRSVWRVTTKPFKGAHFATFPMDLIEPCVLAGCPIGGTVLDPFFGAGTTGCVANKHRRRFIGIELNPTYAAMAHERIAGPMFSGRESLTEAEIPA